MQISKEIDGLLASSASIGYSQALCDVIDEIANLRNEWPTDEGINHYVYTLFNRMQKLRQRSFEVGHEICKPAVVGNLQ